MNDKKEKRSFMKRISDYMFNPSDVAKKNNRQGDSITGLNGFLLSSMYGNYSTDGNKGSREEAAISAIAKELKKADIRHVRGPDSSVPLDSKISRLLRNPNPLMTKPDLLEKLVRSLYDNDNAYIYVKRDVNNKAIELWPIHPMFVEARRRVIEGKQHITLYMRFNGGDDYEFLYSDIIHIKRNYYKNDVFGGNLDGKPNREGIDDILEISSKVNQNLVDSTRSVINGVVKYHSQISRDKLEESMRKFNEAIENSESGILGLDAGSDYYDLKRNSSKIDKDLIEYIDNMIAEYYGVPTDIIRGEFTKAQHESFVQATIEPLIISLQEEFTRVLFTEEEINRGNRIVFYFNKIIFMSVSEILEAIRLLGDSGSLTENEKRAMLGLPPLEELDGVITMSKNYGNRIDIENDIVGDKVVNKEEKD